MTSLYILLLAIVLGSLAGLAFARHRAHRYFWSAVSSVPDAVLNREGWAHCKRSFALAYASLGATSGGAVGGLALLIA